MFISQLKNILVHDVVQKDNVLALLSQLTRVTDKNNKEITTDEYKSFFSNIPNNHLIYVLYSEKNEISENEELIGLGTLFIEKKLIHGGKSVGHIEDIVIDHKFRGKSYGKKMIDFLIQKARELKCYKVILNCDEKNVGFYERLGFKQKNVEMSLYFE